MADSGVGDPPRKVDDPSLLLLGERVDALERELAQLRAREEAWRGERRALLATLEEAEREAAELPGLRQELERAREAEYWLAVIHSSRSWRLLSLLRAPGRRLRRLAGGRRRP